MKKIKVLLVLLILLLITGCSGTYNLDIDKNLKVKEELNVVLEGESNNYNKLNELIKKNEIDENNCNIVIEGNDLKVSYNNSYDSIEEYLLDSFLYKQLFDNISYNTDNKEMSLSASNIFNNTSSKLNYSNNIKLLQINVTTPLEIVDENSDTSSENTYSWIINNDTKEKELFLSIYPKVRKINVGTMIVLSTFIIAVVIIVIILLKRVLESRKI